MYRLRISDVEYIEDHYLESIFLFLLSREDYMVPGIHELFVDYDYRYGQPQDRDDRGYFLLYYRGTENPRTGVLCTTEAENQRTALSLSLSLFGPDYISSRIVQP